MAACASRRERPRSRTRAPDCGGGVRVRASARSRCRPQAGSGHPSCFRVYLVVATLLTIFTTSTPTMCWRDGCRRRSRPDTDRTEEHRRTRTGTTWGWPRALRTVSDRSNTEEHGRNDVGMAACASRRERPRSRTRAPDCRVVFVCAPRPAHGAGRRPAAAIRDLCPRQSVLVRGLYRCPCPTSSANPIGSRSSFMVARRVSSYTSHR